MLMKLTPVVWLSSSLLNFTVTFDTERSGRDGFAVTRFPEKLSIIWPTYLIKATSKKLDRLGRTLYHFVSSKRVQLFKSIKKWLVKLIHFLLDPQECTYYLQWQVCRAVSKLNLERMSKRREALYPDRIQIPNIVQRHLKKNCRSNLIL